MNSIATIDQHKPKRSLIDTMSAAYSMDPSNFAKTVMATCMPKGSSQEEFAAFLLVAHQHKLNPVTREIYAFPKKGGGIQPIVGIDGWMTLINSHPNFDGMEFEDTFDSKGELSAITCHMHRKDRGHPVSVTEYMAECKRPTDPWQKWPARMLRHKAAIQAARYAFGFAGIIDPEEAERSPEVETATITAPPPPEVPQDKPEVEPGPPFDKAGFLSQISDRLQEATDEESLTEIWDEMDVEATLTEDEDALQSAFDLRHSRLAELEAAEG